MRNFRLLELFMYLQNSNFIDETTFLCQIYNDKATDEDKKVLVDWITENNIETLSGRGMRVFHNKHLKQLVALTKEEKDYLFKSKDTCSHIKELLYKDKRLENKNKVDYSYTTYKVEKFDDDYISGWLKPDGDVIGCSWGSHEECAADIIRENDLQIEKAMFKTEYDLQYDKDFLIFKKNYVLLDCPSNDGHLHITFFKRLTKEQKNMLYDYFLAKEDSKSVKWLDKIN